MRLFHSFGLQALRLSNYWQDTSILIKKLQCSWMCHVNCSWMCHVKKFGFFTLSVCTDMFVVGEFGRGATSFSDTYITNISRGTKAITKGKGGNLLHKGTISPEACSLIKWQGSVRASFIIHSLVVVHDIQVCTLKHTCTHTPIVIYIVLTAPTNTNKVLIICITGSKISPKKIVRTLHFLRIQNKGFQ